MPQDDTAQRKYALITMMLASFMTPFMGSAINLAIPSIGQQFNSSAFMLSWVVSSYLLSSATLLLPFGRLADILGRKKIFLLGILIFTLFSFLCGLAWSIQSLIFFRVLQGVGGAAIFGTGVAILASVYPPQERGKVLGLNAATVYIGLSLGPLLGGAMNQHFGWQSIFFLSVLLSLPVVVLTVWKLQGEWAEAKGERFDLAGAALYSAGLGSLLYGVSAMATSAAAKACVAAGLILLALFVRRQATVEQPMLHIKLLAGNRAFAFANLAALINYSATFATGFLLSLHLQVVMGYNSQMAGLILLSQPVLMAFISPYAGMLSDRVEPRLVASWGMGLTTIGLALFTFIGKSTPIWFITANLILLGIGFALFASPNNNAVMGAVERQFYGIASSTLGTMRLVGQAASMALATLIIDLHVGGVQLNQADPDVLIQCFNISFAVFAATCLAGIFASLAREKREDLSLKS